MYAPICINTHMPKKVAVILSEQEYAQVRTKSGAVPLSRWFRDLGLAAVKEAIPQYADFRGTGALRNTCPHRKAKGELCYKCDSQFGNPVIE